MAHKYIQMVWGFFFLFFWGGFFPHRFDRQLNFKALLF